MFSRANKPVIDYSLYGGAESTGPGPAGIASLPPTPGLELASSASVSSSEPSVIASSESEGGSDGEVELESGGEQRHKRTTGERVEVCARRTGAGKQQDEPEPDFLWMLTEEPHRSRRMAILKAHPEVRKLMGHTRLTLPLVLLVLTIQLSTAIALRSTHPLSWRFLLTAYALGGTLNQNIFLAIHEITHNLAFKRLLPNKALAMLANVAIGVPYAMAFKGYHIEHHKFLGEDGVDTDLPSKFEALVLDNVAGKTFFATFQIFFYALRPGFVRSQKPTIYHAINALFIIGVDALLVRLFGWGPVLYLLFSSFFAGSLHPCAAHFIAEHYLLKDLNERKGEEPVAEDTMGMRELAQETTSYYGWLNILCYNVGYHNEHHDFPSIPWTRLPALHRIAHEFYDPLPAHASWPAVTWQFITDSRVGMFSRAKREAGNKGSRIDERVWVTKPEETAGKTGKAGHRRVGTAERESIKVVQPDAGEDDALVALMDEAVERGYGSDHEASLRKRQ